VIYLTVEDVLAIHAEVVGCTEDEAERRLRSLPRLEGALARPMWHAHYVDPDVPYLAAVLTHGLTEGRHFIDGNKRTAFLAMAVFLDRNGYELRASDDVMAEWMVELSRGGSVEQLVAHVRGSNAPRGS
jgi:death on curing protein